MFCEVERTYIEDGFNLYGLRVCVSNFNDCLDLILDRIGSDAASDDSHLTQSACTVYGLIHARYIITAHGLDAMYNKVMIDTSYFNSFTGTVLQYRWHTFLTLHYSFFIYVLMAVCE
jgi:Casein kinase II regulatory subunit